MINNILNESGIDILIDNKKGVNVLNILNYPAFNPLFFIDQDYSDSDDSDDSDDSGIKKDYSRE